MTVSSYLKNLSDNAIIRDNEKLSIRTSIEVMERRLQAYFGDQIKDKFLFGSYTRNTILPRSMDKQSDIDYMVVFYDDNSMPQTYLDRLRRFVEKYYALSEIKQSHPTIKLDLNHITFELVPALETFWSGYKIPARNNNGDKWISTDPNDFNSDLTEKNKGHASLIKPLVRLVKYWNANNSYVYPSFELERKIIDYEFYGLGFWNTPDLRAYFYEFMEDLSLPMFSAEWKKSAVFGAKTQIKSAKKHEKFGDQAAALECVQKLLPPLSGLGTSISRALLRQASNHG